MKENNSKIQLPKGIEQLLRAKCDDQDEETIIKGMTDDIKEAFERNLIQENA